MLVAIMASSTERNFASFVMGMGPRANPASGFSTSGRGSVGLDLVERSVVGVMGGPQHDRVGCIDNHVADTIPVLLLRTGRCLVQQVTLLLERATDGGFTDGKIQDWTI